MEMTIDAYLDFLKLNQQASATAVELARELWGLLSAVHPGLMQPDAAPGPDGMVMLAWDDGRHHLEFEVMTKGAIEALFHDRETGESIDLGYYCGLNKIDVKTVIPEKIELFVKKTA